MSIPLYIKKFALLLLKTKCQQSFIWMSHKVILQVLSRKMVLPQEMSNFYVILNVSTVLLDIIYQFYDHCTPVATHVSGTPGANTSTTTTETKSPASVSTIISLLSTLCRGSPSITHVSIIFMFKHDLMKLCEKFKTV